MNNTSYAQKEEKDKQLSFVLTEMKMENIEPKLKEKNIVKIEQLINTTEEEIDKWKDVPVGYRIKLKKFI
jgi:beta-lactamase superfamily II metal-dependent hydrolase